MHVSVLQEHFHAAIFIQSVKLAVLVNLTLFISNSVCLKNTIFKVQTGKMYMDTNVIDCYLDTEFF